jgi:PBSX family phage terminase large subunit
MPLSPKQILSYQQATKRFNIWVGAVRSGKTYSSILKLTDVLKNGPLGDIMIIGVNRDTIQRNVLTQLYKFLGFPAPASKTNEAHLYGRNIYFVGAHDEGAVRRIQGSTLAAAYVDEATCIPEPFWQMLLSRLSIKGAQLLATCNPESPIHFIKKKFIDRSSELDLVSWHFTLEDNPSLDPKYVENLKKEYTGSWYKRLILGEWALAHGAIFDGFDEINIFDKDYHVPNFYVAGLDYGTINPTACHIAAISPKMWPQIRIEDEYYYDSEKAGRSKTDSELADDIKQFIGWRNIRALYADPAAASIKLELRNRDIPVLNANNDVLFGIKMMSKFISNKNMVFRKSCRHIIEQVQSYTWDPKAAERGEDKPIKKLDHAVDSCRYLLTAFPTGSLSHPDEELTIDQLRRKIYGEEMNIFNPSVGGYM